MTLRELLLSIKFKNIELPSNRKFGFFFSAVFCLIAGYFSYNQSDNISYFFIFLAFIVFLVTLLKADILLPFNKAWMFTGFLLGLIVSPIVLGLIFFGMFTPIAVFTRIIGRDELHLKSAKKSTYWINFDDKKIGSFKRQF